MTKYYIYKITNLINNKVYIGQTKNFEQRKKTHIRDSKNKKFLISRAINKYGVENFLFEIIKECETLEEINSEEKEYIIKYNSRNMKYGYNIDEGGRSEISIEKRKKMSEARKIKFSDVELLSILNDTRSLTAIAKDHGVFRRVIQRLFKENNIERIFQKNIIHFSQKEIETILSDRRSFVEIGKDFNVCSHTIKKVFVENNKLEEHRNNLIHKNKRRVDV